MGILVGLAYFILLVLVSFATEGKWDMSFKHLLTTFCMCMGEGVLGGMLKKKKKRLLFERILCYTMPRQLYIHKEDIQWSISKH